MVAPVARRQWTVAEYHRMADAGILGEDDRVELIAGEVIAMSPIGTRHAACVDRLNMALTRHAAANAIVRVQSPIQLDDYSEPQPDLALLRLRDDFYANAHPLPTDVLLLIEVADSSLQYDRATKLPLYAQSAIPEVWLVSVPDERIERYTQPVSGIYQMIQIVQRGQDVVSTALPGLVVAADRVFG
jgi:Uma2 family endonuclease